MATQELMLRHRVVEKLTRDARLTRREREVLQLLVDGLTTPSIAAARRIHYETAKRHVTTVLHKLGVQRRGLARVVLSAAAAMLHAGAQVQTMLETRPG